MKKLIFRLKGGEGSGNAGHAGIPGHQGGSMPKGSSGGFVPLAVSGNKTVLHKAPMGKHSANIETPFGYPLKAKGPVKKFDFTWDNDIIDDFEHPGKKIDAPSFYIKNADSKAFEAHMRSKHLGYSSGGHKAPAGFEVITSTRWEPDDNARLYSILSGLQ